jgi:hypothetical protein
MAYNPFNIFRRNQKAIFAVLTVFIMIMFTLSSGVMGGDFFDTFTQWLGSRKRGDAVATVDGDKVRQGDLDKLRFDRLMANRYMALLAGMTIRNLDQAVNDQLPRMSPEGQNVMRQVTQDESMLEMARRDPRTAQQLEQFGMGPARMLQRMRAGLTQITESPTMKAEDKEAARTKLAKLVLQDLLLQGGGETYFAAAPNRNQRDQIDFILWQKKADQLGIRFTTEDVGRLVRRELYNQLTDQVQAEVQKHLTRELQGFTMPACLRALGEEFRVRAAQVAVLGPDAHGQRGDKTYGAFPLFSPPYEAFEFFRDRCSPSTYAAIPVPSAALVAEVERRMALPTGDPGRIAPPTDDELKALFDRYANSTPDPSKEGQPPGGHEHAPARRDARAARLQRPVVRHRPAVHRGLRPATGAAPRHAGRTVW